MLALASGSSLRCWTALTTAKLTTLEKFSWQTPWAWRLLSALDHECLAVRMDGAGVVRLWGFSPAFSLFPESGEEGRGGGGGGCYIHAMLKLVIYFPTLAHLVGILFTALHGVDCNVLLAGGADLRHVLASIEHVIRNTQDLPRLQSGADGIVHVSIRCLRLATQKCHY